LDNHSKLFQIYLQLLTEKRNNQFIPHQKFLLKL
jgi:hypothetical protein